MSMDTNDDLNARLFEAVSRGDVALAREALQAGADARYVADRRDDGGDRSQTPVLFVACRGKHRELIELLLAHGADPDARFAHAGTLPDADRWEIEVWSKETCLRAVMPSLELVTLLLDRGADPNLPSEEQRDSLRRFHPLDDAKEHPAVKALLMGRGSLRRKMPKLPPTEEEQRKASRRQHPKKKKGP